MLDRARIPLRRERPRRRAPADRDGRLVRDDQPAADVGVRRRLRPRRGREPAAARCCRARRGGRRAATRCSSGWRRSPASTCRRTTTRRTSSRASPQAAQARALGRADAAAGASAHDRDRHAAHRVRRQVPDRDVARLSGEVPLLLGDVRHGHVPLAPDRVHPRRRSSGRGRSPTSSASSPPRWATTRTSRRSCARRTLGFRTSVSSIRIPAVTEGVLEALHASGDRSITLAPETGTDELRVKMGKPIPN